MVPFSESRRLLIIYKNVFETPAFIYPSIWPPNSPDLNPIDYCVWGILHERVYCDKIADFTKLKNKIRREWMALDSDIVTNAISQWRRRLRACVHAPANISNSSKLKKFCDLAQKIIRCITSTYLFTCKLQHFFIQ